MAEKGKKAGIGAGMLGGAAGPALLALGSLTAFLIMALAIVLPEWAAALLVTALWGRDGGGARPARQGQARRGGRSRSREDSRFRQGGCAVAERSDETRSELARTREEMGSTVDALGYKADVPARTKGWASPRRRRRSRASGSARSPTR